MLLRAARGLQYSRRVNYRQILSNGLNSQHNPNKNIEDDGYSYYKQKSFMDRVASNFQDHPNPGTLILVRHGESEWNRLDLFTGWVDVDLSERGVLEAEHGARLLLERGYTVDICYTSMLKRAIRSSWIILNEINQVYRPMIKSWRLNERMYGALEGHSKSGLARLFGEEQVQRWRSGLFERPPLMSADHPYWHGREKKYVNMIKCGTSPALSSMSTHPNPCFPPLTESLQDTIDRTVPYWDSHILPDLKAGRNVMIVAHRNSIRGLIKHIEALNTNDLHKIAIPNGIPLVYKFDKSMKLVVHKNAVKPLSGIWLEKKGLLRAALEHEEALASRVQGYKPFLLALTHSNAHLKGYYAPPGGGGVKTDTSAASTTSSSTPLAPTMPLSLSTTDPSLALENYLNNDNASTCAVPSATPSPTPTPLAPQGGGGGDALIQSLVKLERERKLLQMIDEQNKNIIRANLLAGVGGGKVGGGVGGVKGGEVYDDTYIGDIYLDHSILTSGAFQDLSRIYSHDMAPSCPSPPDYPTTSPAGSSPSSTPTLKYNLNRLNNVHFFSPLKSSAEDGEQGSPVTSVASSPIEAKAAASAKEDDVLSRPLLIIIRHGKTEHNQLGLFTGWEDAMLATAGRHEAIHAGKLLRKHGIEFGVVYTSWLSRAIETAWLVLNELDCLSLPVVKTWRLNERMYGALTGLSKKMIRQIYGDEQFMAWRRGFSTRPPDVSSFSRYYPGNDARYVNYVQDLGISWFETCIRSLAHGKLEMHRNYPKAESLKDCMERTIPYFLNTINPESIQPGKNVLISSSENAIRGLLMHLCKIPADKIPLVEIPTGLPLVYDKSLGKLRLLDDESWSSGAGPGGISPFVGAHGHHVHGHGVAAVLSRYNFGSAPELLFKVKEGVDVSKGAEGRPAEDIIDADKLTIKLRKQSDGR